MSDVVFVVVVSAPLFAAFMLSVRAFDTPGRAAR